MKTTILALLAVLLFCGGVAAKSISTTAFEEIEDVEATYDSLCSDPDNTSEECVLLRSQLYLAIVDELTIMEWANIEENIEVAIMALQLPDPEVKLHALMVLGKWASQPVVQEATRHYLFDPNVLIAYYAASIQTVSSEKGVSRLAKQFLLNHGSSVFNDLARLYAGSEHPDYAAHQLPKYGNSTPLILADVYQRDHRAAGFATTDPQDQVVAFYREATRIKELTLDQMVEKKMKWHESAPLDSIGHSPKFNEMMELNKKYQETLDQELIPRIQNLGKELEEAINEASDEALFKMLPMPDVASDPSLASAKYFLIKNKGMQPTEMVVVYFDSELAKTIIQLAWTERQKQD